MDPNRRTLYAAVLAAGALILLGRTAVLFSGGALGVMQPWAGALLTLEFALDMAWLLLAVLWWRRGTSQTESLVLQVATAAILVHAVRVLVFVMGRTGPWVDFDVRPEQRALHATRWSWNGVYFAAVMVLLSLVGTGAFWIVRRSRQR